MGVVVGSTEHYEEANKTYFCLFLFEYKQNNCNLEKIYDRVNKNEIICWCYCALV